MTTVLGAPPRPAMPSPPSEPAVSNQPSLAPDNVWAAGPISGPGAPLAPLTVRTPITSGQATSGQSASCELAYTGRSDLSSISSEASPPVLCINQLIGQRSGKKYRFNRMRIVPLFLQRFFHLPFHHCIRPFHVNPRLNIPKVTFTTDFQFLLVSTLAMSEEWAGPRSCTDPTSQRMLSRI
jgi:hypothetical protein